MIKYIETSGRSVEDAISAALIQINVDRDDVTIEVLERGKSGFLGFGSNPARVRVGYEVEGVEPPVSAPVVHAETKTPAPQKVEPKKATPKATAAPKSATPAVSKVGQFSNEDKVKQIETFLVGLMAHMDVQAVPEITDAPDGGYKVVLQGENLGMIIGRRGETLDAIQQITSYAVNRGQTKRVRIHVDAEDYRVRREEALQKLAEKVAGKVIKYQKNVSLEAMNAYERHVIHTALQEYPGISTYSTGSEPNRRTVVVYAPDQQ